MLDAVNYPGFSRLRLKMALRILLTINILFKQVFIIYKRIPHLKIIWGEV